MTVAAVDDDGFEPLCDMQISLRIADFIIDDHGEARMVAGSDEVIMEVGGVWDGGAGAWAAQDAARYQVIRVPRGSDQEKPARELAKWLSLYVQGKSGKHWDRAMLRRYYTMLLLGGRRAGKSHIAVVALTMFCFLKPSALAWAVSPTINETDEIIEAIKTIAPARCYRLRPIPTTKAKAFEFVNGSRLVMMSAHVPDALKRGKVDMVLYNEGQKMHRKGWIQIRGAVGDNAGLVIIAANPPDREIGFWIEELWDQTVSGKIACVGFRITAENNPFIVISSLHEMQNEMSDRDYRREILGEIGPIGDVAFHAFSSANVRAVPKHFVDVTTIITATKMPRRCAYIGGMDFQKDPHMVCVVGKFFADPLDPERRENLWIVDEFICNDANEEELVDAIENCEAWHCDRDDALGAARTMRASVDDADEGQVVYYTGSTKDPNHVGVVADASAWWQDGAHTKGKKSDKRLIARDWRNLAKPQRESDRNPEVSERVKITNALLCTRAKVRRLFISPHCVETIKGLRTCPRKNGSMDRNSKYAHVCDGVSYIVYRFYGKAKIKKNSPEYIPVKITKKGWF